MNDAIRSLQKEHEEKYLKAEGMLAKADPTDAEMKQADEILKDCKGIKSRIEREFKLLDLRGEFKEYGDGRGTITPEMKYLLSGAAGDGASTMGWKDAGKIVLDSYGTTLADQGPGIIGAKRWDAMQDPAYAHEFGQWFRSKGQKDIGRFKALQEGLDDQGGVFVPPDILNRIIMREPTPTRVAGMVTNITTGRDTVTMPRTQYSSDDLYSTAIRSTWTGEIPSTSTLADVTDTNMFGSISIPINTAMLAASLTNDMVEDSAFPIQGWIANQFGSTIDLLRDNMILNGTGRNQPDGILNNPSTSASDHPLAILSGSAGALTADSIVDIAYRVPEQYMDNCVYVINRTNTERTIAQLKASTNDYLFASSWDSRGIANARPNNLAGFPIVRSGFMPNIGASNYPLIFGDLSGYYLVNRIGLTIQILRETKAKQNQFEIVGRVRFGGKPVEHWKMRILKSNNS